MHLIVDGDVLIYKGAFAAEIRRYRVTLPDNTELDFDYKAEADEYLNTAPAGAVLSKVTSYKEEGLARYYTRLAIEKIFKHFPGMPYTVYITSPGGVNYRYKAAQTVGYKNNRPERPKYYDVCREYLTNYYNVVVCKRCEADDAVAIKATELGDKCIIAHIDKDINQVPGTHYHIDREETYFISEIEGMRNLYAQILSGDKIDTIPGMKHLCPLRTCGDEQIKRLLGGATTEYQLFARTYRHVKKLTKITKDEYRKYFKEQMELLYLPRTKDELNKLQEKYNGK